MSGATYDGGEDGSWGVITGESGFAHTGAIVDYESGNVVVTHVGEIGRIVGSNEGKM